MVLIHNLFLFSGLWEPRFIFVEQRKNEVENFSFEIRFFLVFYFLKFLSFIERS